MRMTPLEVGALAAEAAFKIIESHLESHNDRSAAAEHTRRLLTDQRRMLRQEAQELLDERRHKA